jgi:hypothetical protein
MPTPHVYFAMIDELIGGGIYFMDQIPMTFFSESRK